MLIHLHLECVLGLSVKVTNTWTISVCPKIITLSIALRSNVSTADPIAIRCHGPPIIVPRPDLEIQNK